MALSLDSLPFIVLQRVCDYLDRNHTSSLVAFARASKSCYSAATSLLFRTLKFSSTTNTTTTPSHLAEDVQHCHEMLQRAAGFRHVRRLIVDGPLSSSPPQAGPRYQGRPWHRPKISAEERGYDGRLFDQALPSHYGQDFEPDDTPATAVYETNDVWRPLASLVKQLPLLTDLIYGCPGQFPPCLLEALHQHQPQCRLHIKTFKLRSLNAPSTDPYELVLATSPCLYSIRVRCDMQYGQITEKVQNFNYEAVQSLVAGLAPNLRKVHISHASWGATLHGFPPCQPWKGFVPPPSKQVQGSSPSSGSLRCLGIRVGDDLIGTQLIETWKAHTDFSKLQILRLETFVSQDTLECLAASSSFPSLRELVLRLAGRQISRPQTTEFYDIVDRFLCSLPPLSSLKLDGELHRLSIDSILEHRGSALRQLCLSPSVGDKHPSPEDIARIGVHCTLLEDLVLTIHRSKGDATEVATYQALGSPPKLQYLSLVLDASNYTILGPDALGDFDDEDDDAPYPETPNDPSFDDFDQQFFTRGYISFRHPRNGHIRDAFLNCAVDEALVRAIFWTISSGKPPADGSSSSLPLEKLHIRVRGGGCFGQNYSVGSVSTVVVQLGRSWLCERSPRDDCRQELMTRDLGPARLERPVWQPEVEASQLPQDVEPIFRRLWPATTRGGGDDWRNDWRSLPLCT